MKARSANAALAFDLLPRFPLAVNVHGEIVCGRPYSMNEVIMGAPRFAFASIASGPGSIEPKVYEPRRPFPSERGQVPGIDIYTVAMR